MTSHCLHSQWSMLGGMSVSWFGTQTTRTLASTLPKGRILTLGYGFPCRACVLSLPFSLVQKARALLSSDSSSRSGQSPFWVLFHPAVLPCAQPRGDQINEHTHAVLLTYLFMVLSQPRRGLLGVARFCSTENGSPSRQFTAHTSVAALD